MQEQKRAIVARFAEMLRKFADGANLHSSYIPSPDWKLDFWGKHYVDLLKVKIRYDPDSLFYCFHCVGSDRVDYVSSRATANVTNQFLSAVSFACYLYAALFHVK